MSKTVKRAMRVMMIGLVALLGAKAEAHYIVVGGKPKRCNHCVEGEFRKDHEHKPDGHHDYAEFRLRTKIVDYQCPPTGAFSLPRVINDRRVEVNLVVLKRIVEGDVTSPGITIDLNGKISPTPPETFNIVANFSDSLLKELAVFGDCPNSLPPIDVIIRDTALTIVSYSCDASGNSGCRQFREPFVMSSCTLDRLLRFSFTNPPPEGYSYVCRP